MMESVTFPLVFPEAETVPGIKVEENAGASGSFALDMKALRRDSSFPLVLSNRKRALACEICSVLAFPEDHHPHH